MAIDLEQVAADLKKHANDSVGLLMIATALIAEIERLCAEATTTLVPCERCGRGVRPKWLVHDLCPACATCELTGLRIAWRTEHDERVRLEECVKRLEGETRYLRDEVQRWADRAADGA